MDIIYTDSNYKELGYLRNCDIDMELGSVISSSSRNDFQLTMKMTDFVEELKDGSLIYQIDSEYGGIVTGTGANTSSNQAFIYGVSWRGKLAQEVIEPPSGQAYYKAKGDANQIICDLINARFDGLIVGNNELSKISVNKDFRYTNLLEGLENMLADAGARLDIRSIYENKRVRVIVSAVLINNISNEVELNNDYGISLVSKKIRDGVNHVICLGKGELIERTVIHLYKLENGMITTDSTNAIKGLKQNTKIYDYANAESNEDLIEGGKKVFADNSDSENLEITINKNVEIGDIVACRERITGIYMQKQVSQKVIKGLVEVAKIEYKVGE